jgi:hypothetical protein
MSNASLRTKDSEYCLNTLARVFLPMAASLALSGTYLSGISGTAYVCAQLSAA